MDSIRSNAIDASSGLISLRKVIDDYRGSKGTLIPLLQKAQGIFGFLPREAMQLIADETGSTLSKVYGVATFYAQFYFEPRGRHTIQVCRGTACHVKGSKEILDELVGHLGIGNGQTTPDFEFTLQTVACLGTCFLAPVIMIDDKYFGKLKPGDAIEAVESVREEARAARV